MRVEISACGHPPPRPSVKTGLALPTTANHFQAGARPPTRVLLLALATSCTLSVAVVVFAAAFIFAYSDGLVVDHIRRDTQLMKDGLQLFGYQRPGLRLCLFPLAFELRNIQ